MAFDLLNQFFLKKDNSVELNMKTNSQISTLENIDVQKVLREIKLLMPGQTIQGELLTKDGNNMQLLLQNNCILNTKLDQDLSLNMGQLLTFEVKGNHNGQLVLRPLFANMGQDINVLKALNEAGISQTDDTIMMVDQLMKQGMPIKKDLLISINRQMNIFPNVDVSDIIMLHKMQLPVNENNVQQMHLYQNFNQWLFQDISQISDEFINFTSGVIKNDINSGIEFLSKVMNIFIEKNNLQLQESNIQNSEIYNEKESVKYQFPLEKETYITNDSDKLDKIYNKDNIVNQEINNLLKMIKQIKPEQFKDIEFRKIFHRTLTTILKERLLMEPHDIEDNNYVKKYYSKITDFMDKLDSLIKNAGESNSSLGKNITQVKNNLDFMNQVNELYHYIQLPIKMNETQANGELYVYTKKKNQKSTDDNLTALLHLSMEALGNMDIYLTLKEDRLSTKFCLEKEEMIDFIEKHLPMLNERLKGKGYVVDSKVESISKNRNNSILTILNENNGTKIMVKQSFDARA